jgi:hypothetical protein
MARQGGQVGFSSAVSRNPGIISAEPDRSGLHPHPNLCRPALWTGNKHQPNQTPDKNKKTHEFSYPQQRSEHQHNHKKGHPLEVQVKHKKPYCADSYRNGFRWFFLKFSASL